MNLSIADLHLAVSHWNNEGVRFVRQTGSLFSAQYERAKTQTGSPEFGLNTSTSNGVERLRSVASIPQFHQPIVATLEGKKGSSTTNKTSKHSEK